MTDNADLFGILTYIDPLIYFKMEYHNSWMHREVSVKKDFFLHKYVSDLDRDIFQELPIFEPDILGSAEGAAKPPDK